MTPHINIGFAGEFNSEDEAVKFCLAELSHSDCPSIDVWVKIKNYYKRIQIDNTTGNVTVAMS